MTLLAPIDAILRGLDLPGKIVCHIRQPVAALGREQCRLVEHGNERLPRLVCGMAVILDLALGCKLADGFGDVDQTLTHGCDLRFPRRATEPQARTSEAETGRRSRQAAPRMSIDSFSRPRVVIS